MKNQHFQYTAKDGLKIHTYKWLPAEAQTAQAIFLIVHGSVEHAKRYEPFAAFLTKKGYIVYAPDQRAHGITGKESGKLSHIEANNGWEVLMDDLALLHGIIKDNHPSLPIFILGHSMGSFEVRDYIAHYSGDFKGAIISGSTIGKPVLAKTMTLVAKGLAKIFGRATKSPLMHSLLYDKLNREIKGYKTKADFLSRDTEEVQKYIDDELCAVTITYNYGLVLAHGSIITAEPKTFKNTPDDLPIFIISGENDPVGGKKCDEVRELYDHFKKHGCQKTSIKIYEGARHELLNETNKQEVMEDIVKWMETC